jgi:hypothetical protein
MLTAGPVVDEAPATLFVRPRIYRRADIFGVTLERLAWEDPVIDTLVLPRGTMTLRYGFGSGLATRAGDPPGHVWAIGDRGPNIKVRDIISQYGLDQLTPLFGVSGAKIMPRPDVGPTLAELRVEGDNVTLVRPLPLTTIDGRRVSGLANPGSEDLLAEPVFDLSGTPIAPDPDGLDTEGLVALSDGGFWVGDEFGPSLVRSTPMGRWYGDCAPGHRARHRRPTPRPACPRLRRSGSSIVGSRR